MARVRIIFRAPPRKNGNFCPDPTRTKVTAKERTGVRGCRETTNSGTTQRHLGRRPPRNPAHAPLVRRSARGRVGGRHTARAVAAPCSGSCVLRRITYNILLRKYYARQWPAHSSLAMAAAPISLVLLSAAFSYRKRAFSARFCSFFCSIQRVFCSILRVLCSILRVFCSILLVLAQQFTKKRKGVRVGRRKAELKWLRRGVWCGAVTQGNRA